MNRLPLLLTLGLAALAACAAEDDAPDADVQLESIDASGVDGTVSFTLLGEGKVRIDADITGLTPGMHGMHVHEWGDCSGEGGMAAGGHFNPDGVDHGAPETATHHAGDFGNIVADADGHVVYSGTFGTGTFSLGQDKYSVLGRAIIIHEKADTYGQPTGDAGGRLACGVVQIAGGGTEPVLAPTGT